MLWIDKHCPKELGQLNIHPNTSTLLNQLGGDKKYALPHILLYGGSGSGRRTRIFALLRHIFGNDTINNMKADTFTVDNSEISLCHSKHHVQVSCSDIGTRDRKIMQSLIKELAASQTSSSFFEKSSLPKFRVFVFLDADCLSIGAQAALRRTVEKYVASARIILHVESILNIIPPLRSRCQCIRIPMPNSNEVVNVLQYIRKMENLNIEKFDDNILYRIAKFCNHDLRRCILTFESNAMGAMIMNEDHWLLPWEKHIQEICDHTVAMQTPKQLEMCRHLVYDVLTACIPPNIILKCMLNFLLNHKKIPSDLHGKISSLAAYYTTTLPYANKPQWHLEAFLANVMMQFKIGS